MALSLLGERDTLPSGQDGVPVPPDRWRRGRYASCDRIGLSCLMFASKYEHVIDERSIYVDFNRKRGFATDFSVCGHSDKNVFKLKVKSCNISLILHVHWKQGGSAWQIACKLMNVNQV